MSDPKALPKPYVSYSPIHRSCNDWIAWIPLSPESYITVKRLYRLGNFFDKDGQDTQDKTFQTLPFSGFFILNILNILVKYILSFTPEGQQGHQVGGVDSGVFVEVGHFSGEPWSPGGGRRNDPLRNFFDKDEQDTQDKTFQIGHFTDIFYPGYPEYPC